MTYLPVNDHGAFVARVSIAQTRSKLARPFAANCSSALRSAVGVGRAATDELAVDGLPAIANVAVGDDDEARELVLAQREPGRAPTRQHADARTGCRRTPCRARCDSGRVVRARSASGRRSSTTATLMAAASGISRCQVRLELGAEGGPIGHGREYRMRPRRDRVRAQRRRGRCYDRAPRSAASHHHRSGETMSYSHS